MTERDPKRKGDGDPAGNSDKSGVGPQKIGADPLAASDKPSAKPKFVFKIVPADPKNSLDFEDAADK